ncbi:phage protein [Sporomusa sp. KB1]|jgi:hypothetical protein|uniref:phage protein n=1 Tax=Sporomusa sp. KB1 TaxID=943346 RepID=UPI0011A94227|nr:phage protein [Sporomusa sp. KB1]TWH46333.1 uncharacterized protein DUF3277 [Sporomusa sp. KB1]
MADFWKSALAVVSSLFAPVSTYSFLDLTGVINHPSFGAYTLTGKGVGEITISMATDSTNHDIGVDGAVIPTQIPGRNGMITIRVQQTSTLHKWLLGWHNYLSGPGTPRNEWLMTTVLIRGRTLKIQHTARGVSPQKIGDIPYRAQGDLVTWNLMAADIQTE